MLAAPAIAGAVAPPLSDLTGVCFKDQLFLNSVGGVLSVNTVFHYFATSPFYDRSCTNEQMRMQEIHPLDMAHLVKMAGRKSTVEYVLHQVQEPHLFVLKKQIREGPEKATPVAVYYVLDGSIYQAPTLHGVLGARMARALHHLEAAFAVSRGKLERGDREKGKDAGGGSKRKAEEGRKDAQDKPLNLREVARVDQILAAVFAKLPPAPPPPSNPAAPPGNAAEAGGPSAADGEPKEGEAKETEEQQESGAPSQGPSKRVRREA